MITYKKTDFVFERTEAFGSGGFLGMNISRADRPAENILIASSDYENYNCLFNLKTEKITPIFALYGVTQLFADEKYENFVAVWDMKFNDPNEGNVRLLKSEDMHKIQL